MPADDPMDHADESDVEPADVREELDRQRTNRRRPSDGGNREGIVDLLSRAFDTDIRTRVYVSLRRHPSSTAETVAERTGLYPDAVRRVLADLHDERVVERRDNGPADGSPEYTAVPPNELLDVLFDRVRTELDGAFSRDRPRYGPRRERGRGDERGGRTEPVTIAVEEDDEDRSEQ